MNLIDPGTISRAQNNLHQQKSNADKSAMAATEPVPLARSKHQPVSSSGSSSNLPENIDRERLIQQLLAMTPEQVALLPPEQRDQVMRVKAQFSSRQHQK